MSDEHKHSSGGSKYTAGFFLRLLLLLALLGFVLFEVNSATQANTKIDEVVNVYPGNPVEQAQEILDREPSSSRTEKVTYDLGKIQKQIDEANELLKGEEDQIAKSKLEKKIAILTPRLDTPEVTYTVDTYDFLLNPFIRQFVEVVHKDGKVEKIVSNEKFTLEDLNSELTFEDSGRDSPLVAAAGGGPPPARGGDNDNDDDEEDEEEDDEDSDESEKESDDEDDN